LGTVVGLYGTCLLALKANVRNGMFAADFGQQWYEVPRGSIVLGMVETQILSAKPDFVAEYGDNTDSGSSVGLYWCPRSIVE
jgi:hypothetical protein